MKRSMNHLWNEKMNLSMATGHGRSLRVFLLIAFLLTVVSMPAQVTSSQGISLDELLQMLNRGESIDGQKVNMRSVNFELNSTDLNAESKSYLDRVVRLLQITNRLNLKIVGHTDNVGDDANNQRLAESRASSVTAYLTSSGIDASRISSLGMGETQPIASNESEEGRRMNRRVEFEVIPVNVEKKGQSVPIQDVITLMDGNRLGAYGVAIVGEEVRYKQFDDSSTKTLLLSQVKSISYSDGQTYAPAKAVKRSEVPEGDWKNIDPNTSGVTTVKIAKEDGNYIVRVLGKCHPQDCDWGEQKVSISSSSENQFILHWNNNGLIKDQVVSYLPSKSQLKVETNARFEDGSGRQPYVTTEYFSKGEVKRNELLSSAVSLGSSGLRFSGAYITLGSQRMRLPGSEIRFEFVDDSQSQNSIQQLLDLGANSGTFDVGLELSRNRFDFAAGYHGFWGSVSGGGFLPEVGYRLLDLSGIMVRPSLGAYFGKSNIYFGEMYRVVAPIQINEQEFDGESVDVTLKKAQIAVSPNLTIDFPVRHTFNVLRLKLGFNLNVLSGKGKLAFEGLVDGRNKTERKPLSSTTTFDIDGEAATRLPVRYTGFFFQIGYLLR